MPAERAGAGLRARLVASAVAASAAGVACAAGVTTSSGSSPAGVVAGLGVAAAVAWFAVDRSLRPLRDLALTAKAMERDPAARTRVRGADDTAALGGTLDALADGLAAATANLGQERDRLAAILEAMAEGVLVTDAAGNVAVANRALREMFLLGRDVVGRAPIEALRNAELHELFAEVQSANAPITREISIGGVRPRRVMARVAPIDDPHTRHIAVLSDVTELRRLENVRKEFVANVSHELRTPVAAIRAASETLLMGAVNKVDTAQEFVGIIERHAERLHRLVEDLLELSRLESRELKLTLEPVALREQVDRAVELMALSARARKARIVTVVPEGLPPVVIDRRGLEQVLTNLLDNALKYSREGATVTVRAADRDGLVRLSVEDDGPGIEARHLPRLFERFYRVDTSRSRQLGGTGLGLAIVKHLAEGMSAAVSVDSAVGRGSQFHVDLRTESSPTSIPPAEHDL